MGTFQDVLSYGLYGLAAVALVCFALLIILYWYNEQKERKRLRQTRTDIADMTILFQTMRDIISQQKTLAKEFNRELEKKMNLVKQVLARGMEKNEELYEKQQSLNRQLEEAENRLQSMQRQVARLVDTAGSVRKRLDQADSGKGAAAPHATPEEENNIRSFSLPSRVEIPDLDIPAEITEQAPPPDEPPPRRQADTITEEIPEEADRAAHEPVLKSIRLSETEFARWVLDEDRFEEDKEEEEEGRLPSTPPDEPENPEAARAAFRSLLNLEPGPFPHAQEQESPRPGEDRAATRPPAEKPVEKAAPLSGNVADNGRRNLTPAQKRVLEYSEAGMSVAEISRELGIGKGEVRLMLSLVKQHQR